MGVWFPDTCLHCSKEVGSVTVGSHPLSLWVTYSTLLYVMEYWAGMGPGESPTDGVACPSPSMLLSSGSAWSSPEEARRFWHRTHLVAVCGSAPSQAGWFVNVLNSSALGGLTTEPCFVSLPDTPAQKAGLTHAAGSGCFTFERLLPPDKPEGTLCALRTCGGWKVTKLFFLGGGGGGARDHYEKWFILHFPNEHSPLSHQSLFPKAHHPG